MIARLLLLIAFGLAFVVNGQTERAGKSLCLPGERVIFSCTLKRPQKNVALCASSELTKNRGYVQYRFGLPGNLELEFPKQRERSSQSFQYKHYFRAQVDLTEITFTNANVVYSIFDDYNGEEKPPIMEQGITIAPAGGKEVRFVCRGRAKIDFSNLENVLTVVE